MPKLNSGLDRAQSAHNVSKKRSKVERELSSLVDAEDRLQLQKDMQWLAAEVKASPHKMKALKVVAQADVRPSSERNRFLHPDLQGKCQNRLPLTFLKYDLGLRLPGFTKPIIDALSKRDSQVMRKIHAKVSLTSDHHPIGTLCRRTWLEAREERIKIGGLVGEVRWNISFDIDWMKVGHFTLLPPMPSDAEPATWVYETIEFLGMTVPVAGDHKVRGTYIIEQNWDHLLAHIADPMQPWIKVPVWTFFTKPVVEEKYFRLLDQHRWHWSTSLSSRNLSPMTVRTAALLRHVAAILWSRRRLRLLQRTRLWRMGLPALLRAARHLPAVRPPTSLTNWYPCLVFGSLRRRHASNVLR